MPHAVRPQEAMLFLERLRGQGSHSFLSDDISLDDAPEIATERLAGHRQVTDAHLLALAVRSRRRLVTLDGKLGSLLAANHNPVEAIVHLR